MVNRLELSMCACSSFILTILLLTSSISGKIIDAKVAIGDSWYYKMKYSTLSGPVLSGLCYSSNIYKSESLFITRLGTLLGSLTPELYIYRDICLLGGSGGCNAADELV